MSKHIDYKPLHDKLDFLLKDHGVDFDDSKMTYESLGTLHNKADALLVAHNCEIPTGDDSITALQPKLDMLIQGHGEEFDDSDLDPNDVDTVHQKLDKLVEAHGH